jgi:uncharacterized membrane protein
LASILNLTKRLAFIPLGKSMMAKTFSIRSEWFIPGLLILLALVPATAGTARLVELASGVQITVANARFFAAPLPVVLHILAFIPYSILGALQFAPAFRRRRTWGHRAAGRILVVLGLIVALTGLWMTLFYPWPKGDGEVLYLLRLVFGAAMAMAIVLAVFAIRRHDFATHGAWMIRSYAIGMGAGTQVLTHIPYFALVGEPDEQSRAVLMGAGWVINVLVAEWIIRRGVSGLRKNRGVVASISKPTSPVE